MEIFDIGINTAEWVSERPSRGFNTSNLLAEEGPAIHRRKAREEAIAFSILFHGRQTQGNNNNFFKKI